jgi:hypothetical protein
MRRFTGALAAAASLCATSAALAAPSIEINHAVARVFVSPEDRRDIKVEILNGNPRLPLRVWSAFGRTHVDGRLGGFRITECHGSVDHPGAYVLGVGQIGPEAMPWVIVHTPLDVRISVGGAVFGQIGRSASLELVNAGCGEWQVGNVRGRLKISEAGSGSTRSGQSGGAELMSAGSGGISTREVAGPLVAVNVGSGDIEVAGVQGAFNARVAGSGHVRVAAGHATVMQAQIAGSGDIALAGVADSLKASVVGSGDVRVQRVVGDVSKAVVGSGDVKIGS